MVYLIIVGVLVFLISVYFLSYSANKETEVPEGLKERYDEAQTCTGCHQKRELLIPEDVVFEFKEENNLWK